MKTPVVNQLALAGFLQRNALERKVGPRGEEGPEGQRGPGIIQIIFDITLTQTALVEITAGIRRLTVTGITGLLAGDYGFTTSLTAPPDGYAIHDTTITADGTAQIALTAPLLATGASYSIPCKLIVLRAD